MDAHFDDVANPMCLAGDIDIMNTVSRASPDVVVVIDRQ